MLFQNIFLKTLSTKNSYLLVLESPTDYLTTGRTHMSRRHLLGETSFLYLNIQLIGYVLTWVKFVVT